MNVFYFPFIVDGSLVAISHDTILLADLPEILNVLDSFIFQAIKTEKEINKILLAVLGLLHILHLKKVKSAAVKMMYLCEVSLESLNIQQIFRSIATTKCNFACGDRKKKPSE